MTDEGVHDEVWSYADGLGRPLMSKAPVAPDPESPTTARYVGTGRVLQDAKGQPVKEDIPGPALQPLRAERQRLAKAHAAAVSVSKVSHEGEVRAKGLHELDAMIAKLVRAEVPLDLGAAEEVSLA